MRPLGRALSVHQGKGATDDDARLGAMLEAVESHHAERFVAEGPRCRYDALPAAYRPPRLSDVAANRDRPPPDLPFDWVEASNPVTGKSLFLPFDLVSLDFTRGLPSLFDRSSNGLGAGSSPDEALTVALHEAIERDAVGEWMAAGLPARIVSSLRIASIPYDWFGEWRDRVTRIGAHLRCQFVRSITGTPVIACQITDPAQPAAPNRAAQGHGCHPLPEIALFRAVAEAIQSRVTLIAGARDDNPPSDYRATPGIAMIGATLPLPPSMEGIEWDRIEPGPVGAEAVLAALASAGYPDVAVIRLGSPHAFHVTKAHVCGLRAWQRRRRPPVH